MNVERLKEGTPLDRFMAELLFANTFSNLVNPDCLDFRATSNKDL